MKMLSKIRTPPTYISRHDAIVNAKTNLTVKALLISLRPAISTRYSELVRKMNLGTLNQIEVKMNY